MKALVFHGGGDLRYEETPEPEIRPGHVIIDVEVCGICGTDLHVYKGLPANWPVPGVRGHEFAGIVRETAADATRFSIGDRVAIQPLISCGTCLSCRDGRTNLCLNATLVGGEIPGGFAERALVPESTLFPVQSGTRLIDAAMAETLATPTHAFRTNVQGLNRSAVVFGAGPQGLLTLQLAKITGIPEVFVFDVVERRLEAARELGADHVFDSGQVDPVDAVRSATGGVGVDLGFDAAGLPITRQQLVRSLRPGGLGIFIALGAAPTEIDFMAVVPGELRLHGTQCYTDQDFQSAIDLISGEQIRVDPLVTVRPMSDGADVFDQLSRNPAGDIKVCLKVDE